MTARPKAVVTHRVHDQVKQAMSAECEVVANDNGDSWLREKLVQLAGDAQALMAFMPDRIDASFLAACPKLRVIAAALKGYDNIDIAACTERGVWVTAVPDLLSTPTAELALALILGFTPNVFPDDRLIRSSKFQGLLPLTYGSGLMGKTVGILGIGKVGQAFARLFSGFNAKIIYYDPVRMSPVQEAFFGMARAGFEEDLAQSDVLVLMLPLNPSSLHLINNETLANIKPGAYLVNAGRGSVVDEQAAAAARKRGRLAGYAADLLQMEASALPDHPDRSYPGLVA